MPCLGIATGVESLAGTCQEALCPNTPMAAGESLNVLFYVPSRKDLVGNGVIFLCAILLAVGYHYLPVDPANLGGLVHDPTSSMRNSLLLFGMTIVVNYLIVFFAVDKFFLNWRQAASASIGTTVIICLAYSSVWGAYHLQPPQVQRILALVDARSLKPFVQALRAGGVLACLSSVPLKLWTYQGNQEFLDFTPLRKAASEWKTLAAKIEKLSQSREKFEAADHNRMLIVLKNMTDALAGIGKRQPITRSSSQRLSVTLEAFNAWYLHEAVPSPENITGFDERISDVVKTIRSLC